jgi:glycosyltransferase involved in cell wall biosynthesis
LTQVLAPEQDPRMTRIAFVSTMSWAPWGGSEELWSEAALRLRREGHEVAASIASWTPVPAKIAMLSQEGVQVSRRRHDQPKFAVRTWRRLTRSRSREFTWLRRYAPDLVVISQGAITDGLEWMEYCQRIGQPYATIVQANAETWWQSDEMSDRMARGYSAARSVFCVSRHNLTLLERQIGQPLPNGQVVQNPNNVSSSPLLPPPAQDGVLRLACVARLEPASKGQDLLFLTLASPKWRERPVELNLYGSGPCERSLRNLALSLGLKRVHFRGQVPDILQIWRENHLLVLPSRWEGLPLSLIEAMWCGRPAVVTDVGGNTELCLDGETGFVARAPEVCLIDHALERAWERRAEWEAMGKAARARVAECIPKDSIGSFSQRVVDCVSRGRRSH